jgi:hypothetical protein
MARNDEVMVQDVDPLNATIYFDGYMYVGAYKMIPRPAFFAPYFRKPRRDDPLPFPSAVTTHGITWYSEVFSVHDVKLADLLGYPQGFRPDSQVRAHPLWKRSWETGLSAIIRRAKDEPFESSSDPHRLYFLLEPIRLGHTVQKCGRLPQIPWGYGTSLSLLKSSKCIMDLKP